MLVCRAKNGIVSSFLASSCPSNAAGESRKNWQWVAARVCEVSGAGRKTPSQCKMRWERILNPGVKRGLWTKEEDEKLKKVAADMDYKWSHVSLGLMFVTGFAGAEGTRETRSTPPFFLSCVVGALACSTLARSATMQRLSAKVGRTRDTDLLKMAGPTMLVAILMRTTSSNVANKY